MLAPSRVGTLQRRNRQWRIKKFNPRDFPGLIDSKMFYQPGRTGRGLVVAAVIMMMVVVMVVVVTMRVSDLDDHLRTRGRNQRCKEQQSE